MFSPASWDVLRTCSELEALVPEWQALWQQDASATPFQRPEWLVPWWHHFGQSQLYVLCFRHAGKLTGLLPLYVYADAIRKERQLLLLGAGTSDYLNGIFSEGCSDVDIRQGLASLAREETWDVAHLTQIPIASLLSRALASLDVDRMKRYPGEPCSCCPASAITDLPKKVRADVLYFRNFACGRGKLRLHVADDISWGIDFDRLVQQHTARWNEAGLPGVLADPQVLAWHREALPLLLRAKALRLYSLLLEDVPVASLYALIDPPSRQIRTEYFYLIGHSQEHTELKPGMLLTAMASEYAAGEGVTIIDMLRGAETYKKFWHVEQQVTCGFSFERHALGLHALGL